MAGSSRDLGFLNSQRGRSKREESARKTLRYVRKDHPYVDLREDHKKPIFFCVLCLSPCRYETVLHDHLRGRFHKKNLEAAKSTLLKQNPWPFNDGMLFFHTPCNENSSLSISNPNLESNLLLSESNENNSLAIVTSEGSPSSRGDDDKRDVDDTGYHLIVPQVLRKDGVTDLKVRSIGLGRVAVRYYQKDGVTKGISRIWCEWLGDCHRNKDNTTPCHDFAILSFPYNYAMGRKNLLDNMLCLFSSGENKVSRGKKMKSLSDPEDVGESLSNQYESSGKEYLASGGSSSGKVIKYARHDSMQQGLRPSRSVRKELRAHQRKASERVCYICQHKILPGKDVATVLNMKTGRIVCSNRNLIGAFHVSHISCLIHWVLLCEYEVYTKQLVDPKEKKRCGRKEGAKIIEAEKEVRKQIYCVFCPDCQGTGIDIDGDELEKLTASPAEENVSVLKMLRFYRAVE